MSIGLWIVATVLLWFSVEFFCETRGLRVAIQCLVTVVWSVLGFAIGNAIGGFGPTYEANVILKNLSRGLATITAEEDFDHGQFQERLNRLNDKIVPTYETQETSRHAVIAFLADYDIGYIESISRRDEGPPPPAYVTEDAD